MKASRRLNGWLAAPAALALGWGQLAHGQGAPAAAPAPAAGGLAQITEDGIIAGTVNIDFATRTTKDTTDKLKPGSSALGVKDKYVVQLRVAKTTEYAGEITRQPNLYSKLIATKQQSAALDFNVELAVLNPKDLTQKKTVGKWVGNVPIDTATGAYDLAGGKADERPLRIAVDSVGKANAFTDRFGGKLVGKAEKKENLAAYTFKRVIGEKTVQVVVKRSDPMIFQAVELAKGPAEVYPHTVVTGRLDYDYETGNWLTDGIRFRYSVDGKDYEDVVTGTIKWIEDKDRKINGKGHYDFNLRFNEDKHKTPSTEASAFDKLSEEDAFFAVDKTIPALTGTVAYVDTFIPGSEAPASSKLTYNLNANKLTKQQVVNFFKLWVLAIGPTNDE